MNVVCAPSNRTFDLKVRTKEFALQVIKLFRTLPRSEEGRVIGKQILRSGTSIGANYRAACRSRSKAEFISKISIVWKKQMKRSSGSNSCCSLKCLQRSELREC